ncbi:hypothetical protein HOY80DRAFT_96469, partial [Tuber brumale]
MKRENFKTKNYRYGSVLNWFEKRNPKWLAIKTPTGLSLKYYWYQGDVLKKLQQNEISRLRQELEMVRNELSNLKPDLETKIQDRLTKIENQLEEVLKIKAEEPPVKAKAKEKATKVIVDGLIGPEGEGEGLINSIKSSMEKATSESDLRMSEIKTKFMYNSAKNEFAKLIGGPALYELGYGGCGLYGYGIPNLALSVLEKYSPLMIKLPDVIYLPGPCTIYLPSP